MEDQKQVSTLYAGEVLIEFNPNASRNRYKITDCGVLVKPSPPSVTTITGLADFGKSSALQTWAVRCAVDVCRQKILPDQFHGAEYLEQVWKDATQNFRDVRQKAADTGTEAHWYLQRYFDKEPDFAPPLAGTPVRKCFDSALNWFHCHQIESVCNEARVYSRRLQVVGSLDNLSHINGVLSLLDYKAAKSVYSTYILQAAMYIFLREEEFPDQEIQQAVILQLGEEAQAYIYTREQLLAAFKAAEGLVNLHAWNRKIGKPKPEEKSWLETL